MLIKKQLELFVCLNSFFPGVRSTFNVANMKSHDIDDIFLKNISRFSSCVCWKLCTCVKIEEFGKKTFGIDKKMS